MVEDCQSCLTFVQIQMVSSSVDIRNDNFLNICKHGLFIGPVIFTVCDMPVTREGILGMVAVGFTTIY